MIIILKHQPLLYSIFHDTATILQQFYPNLHGLSETLTFKRVS